jgi:ADP-dependent NAD(P)H-hydrate dehydratase / NAD(P)H-hydrate epimerase
VSARPLRPYARGSRPVRLPTGREAAAFDGHAILELGVPEAALMESAGRAVAHLVDRLFPRGEVVGFVGAGNNGGDALVALRTLAAWGRTVRAVLVAERPWPDPLLHGWSIPVQTDATLDDPALRARLDGAGVILDGILGTGLRGAPRERQARAIRAIAMAAAPVVALDVPSGVDADGGAVPGDAVHATLTVAFGWPKLGTLLHPARAHTGRLLAVEIGFPPGPEPAWPAWLVTPSWGATRRPERSPTAHKSRVGRLLLVAGSPGMAGAAVLAARAALRAGVGYLRLASHPGNREILQEAVPDAPFVDVTDPAAVRAALEGSDAVALGPGLGTGPDARAALDLVRPEGGTTFPTVLDADALNLIAAEPDRFGTGPGKGRGAERLVLTPHPGEMARLLHRPVTEVEADRPAAARGLAEGMGATVVLKGAPTLLAEPDGRLGVSGVGGSELAVAGMGDVLTGTVGSLLAQGLSAVDAAGLALLVTARAATRRGPFAGLIASDVPDEIQAALADLGPGESDLDEPWVLLDLDPAR